MKKRNVVVSALLAIFFLSAAMVGCSDTEDRPDQVIEKRTTTTIERPVIERPVTQEKRTTTTTTETR